jgi:hypothetical protein
MSRDCSGCSLVGGRGRCRPWQAWRLCWQVGWRGLGWIGRHSFVVEGVLYCFVVCMETETETDMFHVLARSVVRRSPQALGFRRLLGVVELMVFGRGLLVLRVL